MKEAELLKEYKIQFDQRILHLRAISLHVNQLYILID